MGTDHELIRLLFPSLNILYASSPPCYDNAKRDVAPDPCGRRRTEVNGVITKPNKCLEGIIYIPPTSVPLHTHCSSPTSPPMASPDAGLHADPIQIRTRS